jgi:hypothetical protein
MPLVFRLHCYTQISSQRPQLCPHFCLSLSMTGRIEDSHPASPHVNIMMLQIIAHKACTAIVAMPETERERENIPSKRQSDSSHKFPSHFPSQFQARWA